MMVETVGDAVIPHSENKIVLKDICDCCGRFVVPYRVERSVFLGLFTGVQHDYRCPECGNYMY